MVPRARWVHQARANAPPNPCAMPAPSNAWCSLIILSVRLLTNHPVTCYRGCRSGGQEIAQRDRALSAILLPWDCLHLPLAVVTGRSQWSSRRHGQGALKWSLRGLFFRPRKREWWNESCLRAGPILLQISPLFAAHISTTQQRAVCSVATGGSLLQVYFLACFYGTP